MKIKLIALVALTVAMYPTLAADVAEGASFEAPSDLADQLVDGGKAKLAESIPTKPARTVKVRVLTVCEYGNANDLVELPADVVKQAERDGLVDSDKGAVAYAASLDQNKPKSKAKA